MSSNFMWNIALCGVLFISIVSAQSCKDEPKCLITRTYGLKVADCYNKDFKTIPKCVPTDVQVSGPGMLIIPMLYKKRVKIIF